MDNLHQLLVAQLRDLYDAEKQATKALPKVSKKSSNAELKQALLDHAEVTQGQVDRLEKVFEALGERAKSKPCQAMKGLVAETNETISEGKRGTLLDIALIGCCQKIEHYEVAGYTSVRALAKSMGHRDVAGMLQETLREEEQAAKLLTQMAPALHKEALESARDDEEDDEPAAKRGRSSAGSSGMPAKQSKGGAAAKKQAGGLASAKRSGGQQSGSTTTTDHDEIRRWAEERGGVPSAVKGTGKRKSDSGIIRLDFPGYSGGDSLEEIGWDEFFEKFDESGLALVYQESTADGEKSNFNKLVSREGSPAPAKKRR